MDRSAGGNDRSWMVSNGCGKRPLPTLLAVMCSAFVPTGAQR